MSLRTLFDHSPIGRLLRGASSLFALNIAGVGLAFLLQLLLARALGPEEFGVYAYAVAWLNILGFATLLGHDVLMLREVATYRAGQDWAHLRGALRHAQFVPLLVAMAVAAVGAALALWLSDTAALRNALLAAFLILPPLALLRVRASILCALERPFTGQLPERLMRDAVAIALVGTAVLVAPRLSAAGCVLLLGCGTLVALVAVSRALHRWTRDIPTHPPLYRTPEWMRAAIVMAAMGGVQILLQRTDVLMIGWLLDTTAAGIYSVSVSLSEVCSFPSTAISATLAPTVAALYARGAGRELQDAVTATCRWSLLGTAAIALPLVLVPEWVLHLYGPSFVMAANPLRLLLAAQLLKAGMGAAWLLMTMTGHEARAVAILGLAALGNLLLNLLLIPPLGIEGAALATAMSAVAAQACIAWSARTYTGIRSGPFPVRGPA
ncbi:MAG TPA: oligosaccharide flippase family protein [Azospirillum sp.]|nr:oligosaccharide flippase family protein [Azospirillum sp.]